MQRDFDRVPSHQPNEGCRWGAVKQAVEAKNEKQWFPFHDESEIFVFCLRTEGNWCLSGGLSVILCRLIALQFHCLRVRVHYLFLIVQVGEVQWHTVRRQLFSACFQQQPQTVAAAYVYIYIYIQTAVWRCMNVEVLPSDGSLMDAFGRGNLWRCASGSPDRQFGVFWTLVWWCDVECSVFQLWVVCVSLCT